MKYKTFDHMNCSLAQTLNIIGERWTLLILRDAFFGSKRFAQFERNLGISKNILTARLNTLVEEGILTRRTSKEDGRTDYVLTDQGLELQPVLLSMTHWGDKHRPHPRGERVTFVDRETGRPIQKMGVRGEDGRLLAPRDIRATAGPGLETD
ncbi:helix-turn-helix domain-containing protein [Halioglobus sp. HI00S01]|uniref:winged helix-turn-helix transcriptional regulator n=1 Tax=Halioglobus sp. HI00S01 TaxID=1822214 RepID=UPI0009EEB537|nr:helix-turn-helix domain-containing protein [Halioglobus sp. HI00S01]